MGCESLILLGICYAFAQGCHSFVACLRGESGAGFKLGKRNGASVGGHGAVYRACGVGSDVQDGCVQSRGAGGKHCGTQACEVGRSEGVGLGAVVLFSAFLRELFDIGVVGLHVLLGVGLVEIHEAEENYGHQGKSCESVAVHLLYWADVCPRVRL